MVHRVGLAVLLLVSLSYSSGARAETGPPPDSGVVPTFDAGPPMDTPAPDAPEEGMDSMISEDVGAVGMDAGAGHDSGPIVPVPPSDGCGCRASSPTAPNGLGIAGVALGLALVVRRRVV